MKRFYTPKSGRKAKELLIGMYPKHESPRIKRMTATQAMTVYKSVILRKGA